MSVREYIGARYIPLFAEPAEWDASRTYEPLTVVTYQGDSYTSRQSVPANVPLTDTTYWAHTGNYNAQIEQYRREVFTYNDRITATESANATQDSQLAGTRASGLKSLIETNGAQIGTIADQLAGASPSGLLTKINANETDIAANDENIRAVDERVTTLAGNTSQQFTAINGRVTQNETDIEFLMGEVGKSSYEGAKSIGFGDSNMAGGEAGATLNTYYQICQRLKCTYDNRGVNGARFATTSSNSIKSVIDAATADSDVKLVVLIGGINDYHYEEYNVANFKAAVSSCVGACLTKYPNADICLIWDQGRQHPNARMLRYPHAMATLATYSTTRNVIVPPTFDIAFDANLYASQNHWNGNGCAIVAQRACALLTKGSMYPALTYRLAVAPNGSVTGCHAVVQKIAQLDSYTIEQHADITFDAGWEEEGAFTTLFELPMGIDGNLASGDKYFDEGITLSDSKNLFLNFRQFADNYTSLTDSPIVTVRNRYAITGVSHPQVGTRISIPLRPQQ
jgi:hypothetical protein